jgi:hypothetical protein
MAANLSPFGWKKQLRGWRRKVKSRAVRGLPLFLAVVLSACTPTVITETDFGIVLEGCRIPESCFASVCDCKRASVGPGGSCLLCNPLTQTQGVALQCSCVRDMLPPPQDLLGHDMTFIDSTCKDPSQVCIGRGPLCPGLSARCLPSGLTCNGSFDNEAPPQLVSTPVPDGGQPVLEPHCAFIDDVCCPGSDDDMGVPDLAGTD